MNTDRENPKSRRNNQTELTKIQESEQRYRTLVNGITDYAVFTLDPNGYITSWNPGAIRIKEYSTEEAIGSHFSMLYPKDARDRNEPMDHLHTALIEGSFRGEGLRQTKSGKLFLADVYIRPIYIHDRHIGFAKVVSNLDEQNLLIQEVDIGRKEVSELKHERELREQFISTLTHDLRNPLAAAKLALGMLLKHPDQMEKNIKRISDSIDRTDKMIKDLLDANRIKRGRSIPLKLESSDMIQILEESIETFRLNQTLVEFSHKQNEIRGFWDREGLRRVFENLISNAIKYGDKSRPVSVSAEVLKEQIVIRVHNYGVPIEPGEQHAIFEQFHRNKRDENSQGWGLGLTLVKGIVLAHGGNVFVRSFAHEGTTFVISLPVKSNVTYQ